MEGVRGWKNMQRLGQGRIAGPIPVVPPGLDAGALVALPHEGTEEGPDRGSEVIRGVYVISVAARLLEMHPQTLRKYERLGLVTPTRSLGMLRLYSAEDVVRVRLIKYMVDNLGMNLAGVEFALNFLNRIMDLRQRIQAMAQAEALHQFVVQELEQMLGELGAISPQGFRKA